MRHAYWQSVKINLSNITMISNYLKIALRNLFKSKTFSLINILGLAFGLCCALLIALWVSDEYAIDNYHSKKDRIYWVISELKTSGGSQYWRNSPGPLADALMDEVPEIEQAVRFTQNRNLLFKQEHQKLEESGIAADQEFIRVFDFPLISGDVNTALDETYNIILSEELAKKLFPDSEAINQSITIDDWGENVEYKVTGVLEKIPDQSTLQFEYIVPYESYLKNRPWNMQWGNYNDRTIILLDQNATLEEASSKAVDIIANHQEESLTQVHLYPFKDVYLRADLSKGIDAEGRIIYVRIFSMIAIIIVLIACINFMNLSTARAGKRAKEVGVRKATGANRKELILQFIGESINIALISGVLAVTMADLLMMSFNELTGKSLSIPYTNGLFLIVILVVCILTGILAGLYPAIYLSGFNPSTVLKGAINSGKSLSGFRRILVIVQFSLSITFVVTTIIVYNQLQFILTKDVGLVKENVLYHDLNSIMGEKEAYRNELMQIPEVVEVTCANFNPLNIRNSTASVSWSGKPEETDIFFHVIQTDQHVIETFGIELIEGRGFSNKYDTAAREVIINEEAVNTMLLNEPLGSRIEVWGMKVEVIGIVKDFHHQSLNKGIEPIVIFYNPSRAWRNFIAIKGDVNKAIVAIDNVYSKFEKNYPFDYGFVDQDFEYTYSRISTMGKLSNVFAFVAIFVSCLGLFGLASYMTEQRRKETGIRKVMGASVFGLVTMFTKNFLTLILLSLGISTPLAWYISSEWLSNFAFRIDMSVIPFLIGGIAAIFIAVATVSYHTVKAAVANPVDSLKYE